MIQIKYNCCPNKLQGRVLLRPDPCYYICVTVDTVDRVCVRMVQELGATCATSDKLMVI